MLETKTRRIRYVAVVDAIGRLCSEQGVVLDTGFSLGNRVRELLNDGEKRILLNFTGVTDIDSFGIGELFDICRTVQRQSGELKLVNPSKAVREALHGVQLHRFFDITDDWAVALQSFSRPLAVAS